QAELLRMQRALERLVQRAEVAGDSEVREQLDEPGLELRGGGQVAHPTDGRSGGELTGVRRPRSAALGNEPIILPRTQSQHACVKNADSGSVRQDEQSRLGARLRHCSVRPVTTGTPATSSRLAKGDRGAFGVGFEAGAAA